MENIRSEQLICLLVSKKSAKDMEAAKYFTRLDFKVMSPLLPGAQSDVIRPRKDRLLSAFWSKKSSHSS